VNDQCKSAPWRGLDDLEIATCAWVSWFNEERIHGELNDLTPSQVEADYGQRSQAPRPEKPNHQGLRQTRADSRASK
jgi:hypothetical protein